MRIGLGRRSRDGAGKKRMVGGVELVTGGAIDRHGACGRGAVTVLPSTVDAEGFVLGLVDPIGLLAGHRDVMI